MEERECHRILTLFPVFLITKNGNRDDRFLVFIIEQTKIMIHPFMKICLYIALRLNVDDYNDIGLFQCCLDHNIESARASFQQVRVHFLRQWLNRIKINVVMYVRKEHFKKFLKKCADESSEQLHA